MKTILRELVLLLIVLSPTVGALVLYNQLPDTMATHFGIHNEVNGTISKPGAVLTFALIGLIPILLPGVRKFDPRYVNEPKFSLAFQTIRFLTALIMAFVGWLDILYNLGHAMDWRRFIFVLLGGTFLVIGNYVPVIKPNFLMGIRTPWTLTNDENWRKTHRFAGPVMVIGGLAILAAALLSQVMSVGFFIGAMGLTILLPVGYSFFLFIRNRV